MNTGSLEAGIAEAESATQMSQAYKASDAERLLNALGDKAASISNSQTITTMQSIAASKDFDKMKTQVSEFAKKCEALVKVLDEVGKIHPFIQVAVFVFKTVVELETNRRENDQKVIALHEKMFDLIDVMRLLKGVTEDQVQGGTAIEERLRNRMDGIIKSIKRCSEVCEVYQNRNTVFKFLASPKWKSTFADIAAQFERHQANLQFDLHMYTTTTVANVGTTMAEVGITLATIDERTTAMIDMMFAGMWSPEEQELATFVQQNGGIKEMLKQPKLKMELIRRCGDMSMTPTDFEQELEKDVKTILGDNREAFNNKLEVLLQKAETTMRLEINRGFQKVEDLIRAGPHDYINDKDLSVLWERTGGTWDREASYFVRALCDHFGGKAQHSQEMATDTNESQPDGRAEAANRQEILPPKIPVEDEWALKCITVHGMQSLMEALDDDASSFVTVKEVNEFIRRKPNGWSMIHWIAYWTTGFEMTTNWYWRRIRKNLNRVVCTCGAILPANRASVYKYLQWGIFQDLDGVLAGLRGAEKWDSIEDWNKHEVFSKFQGYVHDEEKRLETILRLRSYDIGAGTGLNVLIRGDRLEKYALPLLCLLLERVVRTIDAARSTLVSPNQLLLLVGSIATVVKGMGDRANELQASYEFRDKSTKGRLEKVFFGIYCYISKPRLKNENWTRTLEQYDRLPDVDLGTLEVPEPALLCQEPHQESEQDHTSELMNFICANCEAIIRGSRLVCSDCTEGGWSKSVDLCSNCWSSTCSRKEDNKHHFPTHILVQIRQPFPAIGLSGLFEKARSMVKNSRGGFMHRGGPECGVCQCVIVERGYWRCLTCNTPYICISCNMQIEGEGSGLLQGVAGAHTALHTLVLVQGPSSQAELKLEELIQSLRSQSVEHGRAMSEGFERLLEFLSADMARNAPH